MANTAPADAPIPKKLMPKKLVPVIVCIILLAIGVGYYFYHKSNAPAYSYHYSKLGSYKVSGSQAGSGISFDKPEQYTSTLSGQALKSQADFSHKKTIKGKSTEMGSLTVSSSFIGNDKTALLLASSMANTVKSKGDGQTAAFKLYATTALSAKYKVTVDNSVQALTTPNLKTNAWRANLTATPKQLGVPVHKGEVVIMFGKNSYYTFVLENVDINWASNQATWQKVVDSIKLDQ